MTPGRAKRGVRIQPQHFPSIFCNSQRSSTILLTDGRTYGRTDAEIDGRIEMRGRIWKWNARNFLQELGGPCWNTAQYVDATTGEISKIRRDIILDTECDTIRQELTFVTIGRRDKKTIFFVKAPVKVFFCKFWSTSGRILFFVECCPLCSIPHNPSPVSLPLSFLPFFPSSFRLSSPFPSFLPFFLPTCLRPAISPVFLPNFLQPRILVPRALRSSLAVTRFVRRKPAVSMVKPLASSTTADPARHSFWTWTAKRLSFQTVFKESEHELVVNECYFANFFLCASISITQLAFVYCCR